MTSAPPVAHEGMDAKMGAKKTETKNARPVTIAVIPVLPPSSAAVSIGAEKERETKAYQKYQ